MSRKSLLHRAMFAGLAVLMIAIVSGCRGPAKIDTSGTAAQTSQPPGDGGFWVPSQTPRAHYTIDCRITTTPEEARLEGVEVVRLANLSGESIRNLVLDWPSGSAGTLKVSVRDTTVPTAGVSREKPMATLAEFQLPEPLLPGEDIEVTVKFSLAGPVAMMDCIRAAGWYPRLWWGFETHDDYDVKVEVPEGYVLGTSGRLDPKTGRHRAEGARLFGLFIGKGMQVLEGSSGDVLVRAICTDKARPCAKVVLETAIDAIGFYRERFGFYPHRSLTIVPGEDDSMGGYPVATALVAIHSEEKLAERPESSRWITAHEIGHQYWGEYVLEKDSPGWLWIASGIYADRGYARARGLDPMNHKKFIERYVAGVRKFYDTTVNRSPEGQKDIAFDFNNVVIHGKGYSIVSALECVLGEETLLRAYKRCLREFGGRRMGAREFQAACEDESGQNLEWFFDQWVRSNRYLSYEIESKETARRDGMYVSRVKVKCGGTLRMPVPVEASFEDGTKMLRFTDRLADSTELVFESASPLAKVEIDPLGQLPLVVPPLDAGAKAVGEKIAALAWTGSGAEAHELFPRAKSANITDMDTWFKLAFALYDGKYYDEAMEAWHRVAELDKNPVRIFAALVWQGHMADLLGRREEALAFYTEALKRDPGFPIRHDQYGMKVGREWVEERLKEPFKRPEPPR